jgi:hypothetical protein
LLHATATLNDSNVVRFDVRYQFTQGHPSKSNLGEFNFPGTDHRSLKALEAWELGVEGRIKAGVELSEGVRVQEFSIGFSEAESPDRGYSSIANVLQGTVAMAVDPKPGTPNHDRLRPASDCPSPTRAMERPVRYLACLERGRPARPILPGGRPTVNNRGWLGLSVPDPAGPIGRETVSTSSVGRPRSRLVA